MSREGAPEQLRKKQAPPVAAGTPIWVWIVYVFGLFAAVVFAFSLLFTAGALFLSDDVPVSARFSAPAAILWGGLIVLAAATWFMRRRRR